MTSDHSIKSCVTAKPGKDLIPIKQVKFQDQEIQGVDARQLHEFLGITTSFKYWSARRIKGYAFIEGQDFCTFLSESTGGRPAREYTLGHGKRTIDGGENGERKPGQTIYIF